ncbi:MAG: hypothetical protein N3C63_09115 [Rhodocyclaceae bacterium]|nr:hypothetical protein [Rhodocyclaceae bacterium]
MAARTWTAEQRERQSRLIHGWKPWLKATGPKTSTGKAKASRNAFRVTYRKLHKAANYLAHQQMRYLAGRSCDSIDVLKGRLLAAGIDLEEIA